MCPDFGLRLHEVHSSLGSSEHSHLQARFCPRREPVETSGPGRSHLKDSVGRVNSRQEGVYGCGTRLRDSAMALRRVM